MDDTIIGCGMDQVVNTKLLPFAHITRDTQSDREKEWDDRMK